MGEMGFFDGFDITGGRLDRDAGMSDANRDPVWAGAAYAVIVQLAKQQPEIHVDDVIRIFKLAPPHYNAWGGVWQTAIRNGVIVRTGRMRQSADRKKHAHQYPIYQSLLFHAATVP